MSRSIDSLSGLAQTRPGLAAALAIFMLSLAGIPPFFGFWPKLLVFKAAVAEGLWPLPWPASSARWLAPIITSGSSR